MSLKDPRGGDAGEGDAEEVGFDLSFRRKVGSVRLRAMAEGEVGAFHT